ncbi:MAG: guanylate kinase [Clostridia bacterium]|nr:guanylate kinase [Clostridia bacterium]
MREARKGMLLVISGPSGAGKGTLYNRVLAADPTITFSVSYTTRGPRPGEVDGKDYCFVTEDQFRQMLDQDGFLEHADVHGHMYGTPRQPVLDALEAGRSVMLDIDPQGALQVMEKMPDCVSVFILPPSFAELRRRLTGRGTEKPEEIERRLHNARGEVKFMGKYQYLVVNDDLEVAYRTLQGIVDAEKQRSSRFFPVVEEE